MSNVVDSSYDYCYRHGLFKKYIPSSCWSQEMKYINLVWSYPNMGELCAFRIWDPLMILHMHLAVLHLLSTCILLNMNT